jgi:type I restriction enzyme S subunit
VSLPRYPEYKDSGVWWLGSIPAHWRVDRLKASITACKNGIWGGDPSGNSDDIECVRVADFDRARLVVDADVPTLRSVSEREREGRLLQRGDLLLEKSGGGEKQPVGQVALYDRDAPPVCSNFVARVSLASGMVPRFWMYQHAAAYASGVNVAAIKQTSGIQNLDQSQYFDERGVYPDEDEQHAIATFLDRETAKIDALIAEQEKLLALLAEKRQATISHAVTRGLNSDAPMKDSGIPWLGEVPAHWDVRPLKSILSTPVTDGPHETPAFLEEGVPFVSAEAVSGGFINFERIRGFISQEDDARYASKYRPQIHDIYMVKSGATTGVTAIVEDRTDFNIWSPLAAIRCDQGLAMPHFVLQFLRSKNFQEGVALNWSFGTQQNIGMGVLGDRPVLVPPMPEQ